MVRRRQQIILLKFAKLEIHEMVSKCSKKVNIEQARKQWASHTKGIGTCNCTYVGNSAALHSILICRPSDAALLWAFTLSSYSHRPSTDNGCVHQETCSLSKYQKNVILVTLSGERQSLLCHSNFVFKNHRQFEEMLDRKFRNLKELRNQAKKNKSTGEAATKWEFWRIGSQKWDSGSLGYFPGGPRLFMHKNLS